MGDRIRLDLEGKAEGGGNEAVDLLRAVLEIRAPARMALRVTDTHQVLIVDFREPAPPAPSPN